MTRTNFEVDILASGSKGNATLVQAGHTAILIDVGISCRRIVQSLAQCGLTPEDLGGVFLTHEHKDHVAGLEVFARQHPTVPIFANEKTWSKLPIRRQMPRSQVRIVPRGCTLGALRIASFKIPHDAVDPVGYQIFFGDEKCTYLTDCGSVTKTVEQAADGAAVLILEANHDEDMLRNGPYPYALQQRILGSLGHLSNTAAGKFLTSLDAPPLEVFLAHLSEKNNTPQVARDAVAAALASGQRTGNITLRVAKQRGLVSNVQPIKEWKR